MINEDRLIETFIELVKIDSPSGEEDSMAKEMGKRLRELGGRVEEDSFGNVIAKFEGSVPPTPDGFGEAREPLLLNAHLDTVEPGRGIKPKVGEVSIETDGTTILGGDDKAGLAIILEAITTSKEKNLPHVPLEVVLTRGEEIGLLGAVNLDYSKITAIKGASFDGHGPVNNITVTAPGIYTVDVTIIGRSAHAGVEPEKGISAIEIASKIISELKLGRIDEETTANIGLIEGGSARNAVAERVHFKGEARSLNSDKLEAHIDHFRDIFQKFDKQYEEATLEIEMTRECEPYNFNDDHPMVKRILEVCQKLKIKPSLEPTGGAADVNIFNGHGLEVVCVGTGDMDLHTKGEYLVIKDFIEAANFAAELMKI